MSLTDRYTIEPGETYPIGATPMADGVNFVLFSAHAVRVELCIFDKEGKRELTRLSLPERSGNLWCGFVPNLALDCSYAYRVHGPYDPHAGHRYNANKLLLDPYAKSLVGQFKWTDKHFGYIKNDSLEDLSFSTADNASYVPKARILGFNEPVSAHQPWRASGTDRVIYELHVKGFTQGLNLANDSARGTLAALAEPETLAYLKSLGVTTLELMPVHAFINDYFLHKKKLVNYWGYNTLGFFAPHQAYMPQGDPFSFRRLIDRIHDAGFEVVMDVVYNHSAEGDHLGPTLSMRGIDNTCYYRLADDKRHYINDTGCGNTLDFDQPRVVQLVVDSLRYWVTEMGIDGFRFDLAPILARRHSGFDSGHPLLQAIQQDPSLSRTLFIAEPWDIGPGGYQLGAFPQGWLEWNDRYRDTVRRFWRGDAGVVPEFARRIHGSADIFEARKRKPLESLNFITSHDGFTLYDWVRYRQRHNRINGEQNRDGHHENFSSNWGHEGETSRADIEALREKLQRAMLMTLILSQGTPMLLAGDERNRTQRGNNNAYCQDNELNWIDWDCSRSSSKAPDASESLIKFCASLINLRKEQPLLGFSDYIHAPHSPNGRATLWFNAEGSQMKEAQWHQPDLEFLGYMLRGQAGEADLYMIFNRAGKEQSVVLPAARDASTWHLLICSDATAELKLTNCAGEIFHQPAHAVSLLSSQSLAF